MRICPSTCCPRARTALTCIIKTIVAIASHICTSQVIPNIAGLLSRYEHKYKLFRICIHTYIQTPLAAAISSPSFAKVIVINNNLRCFINSANKRLRIIPSAVVLLICQAQAQNNAVGRRKCTRFICCPLCRRRKRDRSWIKEALRA